VTAPGNGEHYTRGALGCALSHFALWDQAVATNQITTVCEDDVISAMNGLDYSAR
jgi:GR25 family glycosyltransferase involved in LPS biosynthesis